VALALLVTTSAPLKARTLLGQGQNHLAVAGGCRAAFWIPARLRRTHPLPRGGSDPVQV